MISTNALKPQNFGIADKKLKYSTYLDTLLGEVEKYNKNNSLEETGIFIDLLIRYHTGYVKESHLIDYFRKNSTKIEKNKINRDFGEAIGPLGCLTYKLFPKMTTHSIIFFPSRPNEPLMDYGIDDYVISAKTGVLTNTVKAHDILNLLGEDKSWKNSLQYDVFEILIKNSTLHGSAAALDYLSDKGFPQFKGINIDSIMSKRKHDDVVNLDQHSAFIKKFASTKIKDNIRSKKPTTLNEFMYCCDVILQELSKKSGRLDFTNIFKAAVDKKVYYVKFELKHNGLPDWVLITADDIVKHRPYLRTKNTNNRYRDKIGIQL